MMSYRQMLLDRKEPLEAHEVRDLREWLEVLKGDVATFGATPEDEARMAAIARKVAESGPPPTPGR